MRRRRKGDTSSVEARKTSEQAQFLVFGFIRDFENAMNGSCIYFMKGMVGWRLDGRMHSLEFRAACDSHERTKESLR